jgi:hypothetical protein
MFYKTTETCTIDTSDVYVNGEKTVLVFEADNVEEMEAYFAGALANYVETHGLAVTIEAIEAEEVEGIMEANNIFDTMNVKDFN